MKVFIHHIYEYQKGLRSLILHTAHSKNYDEIIKKLVTRDISFHVDKISETKINIFFGAPECVTVVKQINKKRLSEYTPEEDFILGTMLGYDGKQQCSRFLKLKQQQLSKLAVITH